MPMSRYVGMYTCPQRLEVSHAMKADTGGYEILKMSGPWEPNLDAL